jgi:hypothetical protein
MSRQKMSKKGLDAKVFKRTARHIRKKNLIVENMRGGIRL